MKAEEAKMVFVNDGTGEIYVVYRILDDSEISDLMEDMFSDPNDKVWFADDPETVKVYAEKADSRRTK